jgi:alpha-glucosidase
MMQARREGEGRLAGLFYGALVAALTSSCQSSPPVERIDPPEQGFYGKRLRYAGIEIKSHDSIDDRALTAARERLEQMLRSNPSVSANLAAAGAELHIIGADQVPSDLPENRHFKGRPYEGTLTIDERTRGTGGGLAASCGEENLLKFARDRYEGRDVCVHEFAHTIYNVGVDEATRALFAARYSAATARGLWNGTYAGTNPHEFFAELSMWYFGTHGDPGALRRVERGPAWLAAYDAESFALVERFYRGLIPGNQGLWPRAVPVDVQKEHALRSAPTPTRARLLVRNRSNAELKLYWLDFDGARKLYASIPPLGTSFQDTFAHHVWLVTAADGTARALTLAVPPASVLVVEQH